MRLQVLGLIIAILCLGCKKYGAEEREIKVTSTPLGIEIYVFSDDLDQSNSSGKTPITVQVNKNKHIFIAGYFGYRIVWIQVPEQENQVHINFEEEAREVTIGELKQLGKINEAVRKAQEANKEEWRIKTNEKVANFEQALVRSRGQMQIIRTIADFIIQTVNDGDEILGLYQKKWYEAIYKKGTDFNYEVDKAYEEAKATGGISSLTLKVQAIQKTIEQLQKSKLGNKEAFDLLLDMYTAMVEVKSLVLEPRGSLQTFQQKRDELKTEALKKSIKLDMLTR